MRIWTSKYLDTINAQGIVKVKEQNPSGFLFTIIGTDAKGVDGTIEVIEYGFGSIAHVSLSDLKAINTNFYGTPIVEDPGKVVLYLPLAFDVAGYRKDFDGEIRIALPAGYTIKVSMVPGIKPSVGITIDSFVRHIGTGRVKVESGIYGKMVQAVILQGNFTEASLRNSRGDIITEGDKDTLRGINTIFWTPETPTNDAILIAMGNQADDCFIDLQSAAEQDFRFIVIAALPDKAPAPPRPNPRDSRAVTR